MGCDDQKPAKILYQAVSCWHNEKEISDLPYIGKFLGSGNKVVHYALTHWTQGTKKILKKVNFGIVAPWSLDANCLEVLIQKKKKSCVLADE